MAWYKLVVKGRLDQIFGEWLGCWSWKNNKIEMFSKLRIAITLGAIALLTANTSAVKLRATQDAEAVVEDI